MSVECMKIVLKLFAAYREAYNLSEIELELPGGTTCTQLHERLVRDHPGLERWEPVVRFGINQQFVPAHTELHEGDELVLIPPVSGG